MDLGANAESRNLQAVSLLGSTFHITRRFIITLSYMQWSGGEAQGDTSTEITTTVLCMNISNNMHTREGLHREDEEASGCPFPHFSMN